MRNSMDYSRIKKIFFVGIKGVGVAPLSIIAHQRGFRVAGSDIAEEFITDKPLREESIKAFEGFHDHDLEIFFADTPTDECLLITTGAHKGLDNPQVKWAKNKNIEVLTLGQALGKFMDGSILGRDNIKGISIAGSHGKTTISALAAVSLSFLSFDPSFTIGTGEIFPIGSPGHYGKGEYFIAEADEYASEPVYDKTPKFLYQTPTFAIFNNIDFDHPDMFKDIDEVYKVFKKFALKIKSGGVLFINGDDERLIRLKNEINKDIRIISYGEKEDNDYRVADIIPDGLSSSFTVFKGGAEFGTFRLNIPGAHNAKNSLSVIALLHVLGVDVDKTKQALMQFKGSKRRLEVVGNMPGGALIIDDYGHHPLEISITLATIRKAYPDKRIVCVFQSHTYSRTKSLMGEFARAFHNTDELLLLPVFKSARDTEKDVISNEEYVKVFKEKNDKTTFYNTFEGVVEYIMQNCNSEQFVVVTMGAGDVYKIANRLKQNA